MTLADELEALAAKATAEDWEAENDGSCIRVVGSDAYIGYPPKSGAIASLNDGEYIENRLFREDAALIVALKNNVDKIIAALRAMENNDA